MGHIKIARGGKTDIKFKLRDKPGGVLVDDQDWVDGATAAQWPVVTIKTLAGGDVTSSFAKDLTGESIDAGGIKHPTASTGIWRKVKGEYRIRVLPLNSLALAEYTLTVTYDVNGSPYAENHTITLSTSGDVDFGDQILSTIEVAEVKAGISTTLTDPEITDLIKESADYIDGLLDACGVDSATFLDVPKLVRTGVLLYARALVFERDASAFKKVTSIRSGDEAASFSGNSSKDAASLRERADAAVEKYCMAHGERRKPRLKVSRQLPGDGEFVDDGDPTRIFGG